MVSSGKSPSQQEQLPCAAPLALPLAVGQRELRKWFLPQSNFTRDRTLSSANLHVVYLVPVYRRLIVFTSETELSTNPICCARDCSPAPASLAQRLCTMSCLHITKLNKSAYSRICAFLGDLFWVILTFIWKSEVYSLVKKGFSLLRHQRTKSMCLDFMQELIAELIVFHRGIS